MSKLTFKKAIEKSVLPYAFVDDSRDYLPLKAEARIALGELADTFGNEVIYGTFENHLFRLADEFIPEYMGGCWNLCIIKHGNWSAPMLFLDDLNTYPDEIEIVNSNNYFKGKMTLEQICLALSSMALNHTAWTVSNWNGYQSHLNNLIYMQANLMQICYAHSEFDPNYTINSFLD